MSRFGLSTRLRTCRLGPVTRNPKVVRHGTGIVAMRRFDHIVEAWKVHPCPSAINHMTVMSFSASGISAGLERLPERSLGLPELSLRLAVPRTDAFASTRAVRLAPAQPACPGAPPRFDRDLARCVDRWFRAGLRRRGSHHLRSRAIPTRDHARSDRCPTSTPWIQGFQPEVGTPSAVRVVHPS